MKWYGNKQSSETRDPLVAEGTLWRIARSEDNDMWTMAADGGVRGGTRVGERISGGPAGLMVSGGETGGGAALSEVWGLDLARLRKWGAFPALLSARTGHATLLHGEGRPRRPRGDGPSR